MGATGATYCWQVRTYECGPDGLATLPTICNYLQEAASLNAESLKFSKSDFDAAGENISIHVRHSSRCVNQSSNVR